MTSILKGQNITVTGGTGSIGGTIVRRALKEGAKSIKIFSNDENGLYELAKRGCPPRLDSWVDCLSLVAKLGLDE